MKMEGSHPDFENWDVTLIWDVKRPYSFSVIKVSAKTINPLENAIKRSALNGGSVFPEFRRTGFAAAS